jgi:tyrosine-protein kinase Etk/Wzc
LSEEELELVNLSRPVKVSTDIFTFLLQKHQEARVAKASTVSDSRIIDTAITPQRPIKPDKRKNIIMGLLVGLFLGVGSALLLDMLDNTIKDAQEAKEQLGLPILSVIPFIPSHGEGKASLVTHFDPKSAVSEVFRSLRTNIHFSAVNKRKQFLMVTSAFPGEGKTTIIGNLAVVLGQSRSRVLLMDCDLRRPSLHTLFGKGKAPGLTELLAGDTDFDKVIYDTGIPGVDFISAGTTPPNPAELLGSEVMKGLLNSLAERYDIILLDAPPVLAVTDAPLLSLMSDMVLVVIEARRVPLKAAHHMLEMLENVGAPLAGIVLNNKDVRSVTRYGYYGASYYGHSYYGEDRQVPDKAWWRRWLKI